MGIADRDYHRNDPREGPGVFAQITPVVKWLLILNLGIYFLDTLIKDAGHLNGPIRIFGAFAVQSAVFEGRIWEFITFQFMHGSVAHVAFNCLGIFFFGTWMERWWGSRKFLIFYLACGAAGAVFFVLLLFTGLLPHDSIETPLIGASAGLYGILIGVAVVAPDLRVRLLIPPVELSIRQLAMGLMGIAVATVLLGYANINFLGLVENEGGQAGHLGGAILGYFLVRYPWILGKGRSVEVIAPKAAKPAPIPKLRPRTDLEKYQDSAVDKILDKISREGFQSLTQEERDFLHKTSNHK